MIAQLGVFGVRTPAWPANARTGLHGWIIYTFIHYACVCMRKLYAFKTSKQYVLSITGSVL